MDVTPTLELLKDVTMLKEGDNEDFVPKGYYHILTEATEYYTGLTKEIVINKNDIINFKYHANRSRLNGCCGLDGCDGINLVCLNGHEVATEKSDCWMPHAVIFENHLVLLKVD
ncbi:MAG: hypothetical protein H0W73_04005 [Bacteroidetes bacterium]|nr:hypothetical protein [Bacteroidota bacterium]